MHIAILCLKVDKTGLQAITLCRKDIALIHKYKEYRAKQVDILISKNCALQILYLKCHDNVYKTS